MTDANTPAQVPESELTPEQLRDLRLSNLMPGWQSAKDELAAIKNEEMRLRKEVTEICFPNPKKGTQRFEFANGFKLKLVHGWAYKLGDKDKIGEDGVKIAVADQVDAVLDKIAELGAEGRLLAQRLVKWSPELVVSEYEALGNSSVGLEAKALIDAILTVEPKSPTLDLEPPK